MAKDMKYEAQKRAFFERAVIALAFVYADVNVETAVEKTLIYAQMLTDKMYPTLPDVEPAKEEANVA